MSIFVVVLFSVIYASDSSLPSKTGLETISDDPQNIGSGEWTDAVYPTNQNYALTEECLPAVGSSITCEWDGEGFVSGDCRSGFECVRVTDCPNNGNEEYWGKRETTCYHPANSWYSAESNGCIRAVHCPGTKSKENCEVRWVFQGSIGFYEDEFANGEELGESFCRVDSGDPGSPYSYGTWYANQRSCVTELKTYTYEAYEVLAPSRRNINTNLFVDDQTGDLGYFPSNAFFVATATGNSQFVACIDDNNKIAPGFKYPGQPPHYAYNPTKQCGNLWRGILCKPNDDNYYDP